jgi:hypothetical protein
MAPADISFGSERRTRRLTNVSVIISLFFDNDVYKGSRLSVIMDEYEKQEFSPLLPTAAPTIPAANPKPARQKATR